MEKYKVKALNLDQLRKFKLFVVWENQLKIVFRSKIRIEIRDGLIRLTTNEDGTWINTNQPFDLLSPKIKKQELKNIFIGTKGQKGNGGIMIVKLYKRTN